MHAQTFWVVRKSSLESKNELLLPLGHLSVQGTLDHVETESTTADTMAEIERMAEIGMVEQDSQLELELASPAASRNQRCQESLGKRPTSNN